MQRLRSAYAPFEHLSAVVAQELRSGARSAQAATLLQRHVFDALERRGRIFAPTVAGWKRAGVVLVTNNGRDFTRIQGVLPFEFVHVWPDAE